MSAEQLDRIEQKMETITKILLASLPSHKLPTALKKMHRKEARTPDDVRELRKREMLRIFTVAGRDLKPDTKVSQKYPAPIALGKMEAVPRSILINRCSVNLAFVPVLEYMESSAAINAEETLDSLSDQLVVVKLSDTNIPQSPTRISKAVCVFSKKEYESVQKNPKMILSGDADDDIIPEKKGFSASLMEKLNLPQPVKAVDKWEAKSEVSMAEEDSEIIEL